MCLNARSIINKKTELNIMVDDIKPHIIGITESWANNDITDAELGLEGYVMFMKDRMGRREGGVLLYIKESIPAYEVQLQEEADCKEALWCNLVTGHTTVTIGVVYRCPNIIIQNNEKIHKAISEVSKGDCIIMGDFNHGDIKWDSQQSTGVEDQTLLCLVQDNFLTQHVLEPTRAARILYTSRSPCPARLRGHKGSGLWKVWTVPSPPLPCPALPCPPPPLPSPPLPSPPLPSPPLPSPPLPSPSPPSLPPACQI